MQAKGNVSDIVTSTVRVPARITRRLTGRLDPLGLGGAMVALATSTATGALPRTVADVGVELGRIAIGRSTVAPDPKDWRFKNPAWTDNPAFRRLGQAYLACTQASLDLVERSPLDCRTKARARLATSPRRRSRFFSGPIATWIRVRVMPSLRGNSFSFCGCSSSSRKSSRKLTGRSARRRCRVSRVSLICSRTLLLSMATTLA